MDFFGIPVNDDILLSPRPEQLLAIGKQFLGSAEVYDDLLDRLSSANMNDSYDSHPIKSFYEALAGLEIEIQDECFKVLIEGLNEIGVYGFVIERLKKGNDTKR